MNKKEVFTELKNSQVMEFLKNFDNECGLNIETRDVRISRELEHVVHVSIVGSPEYDSEGKLERYRFDMSCKFYDDGRLSISYLASDIGTFKYFKPGMEEAYKELLLTVLTGEKLEEFKSKQEADVNSI